jgi:hypothetical protein
MCSNSFVAESEVSKHSNNFTLHDSEVVPATSDPHNLPLKDQSTYLLIVVILLFPHQRDSGMLLNFISTKKARKRGSSTPKKTEGPQKDPRPHVYYLNSYNRIKYVFSRMALMLSLH